MTDPIADLLSQIRNGYLAKKRVVVLPYSQPKEKIVEILVKEGFLAKSKVEGKKPAEKKQPRKTPERQLQRGLKGRMLGRYQSPPSCPATLRRSCTLGIRV